MTQGDDELLNYEEDQAALAKNGLAAEAVIDATAQQADVTLKTKPATKEVAMKDATLPGVPKRLHAFRINTAFGQHWLRNVPRAHATFPPRRLDPLHFGSAGDAPDSQPSTSGRSNDATLDSVHSCRINRYDASSSSRLRSGHDVSSRSSPRSRYDIDSHLPNDPFSVLQLSGPSSSPFDHNDQKRQ